MKTIIRPEKRVWQELCRRPVIGTANLDVKVKEIINQTRLRGDTALIEFSEKFDGCALTELQVSDDEIAEATKTVPDKLKSAINSARRNIEFFHSLPVKETKVAEITKGVTCWSREIAIEKVGLYVPGGSAPLFSTVLMLALPARIAGCREIIVCTPPDSNGAVNPLILYAASVSGVTGIYRIGGAQAIAAMAYGTRTVPRVQKIFGPGNQFVTKAKELVQADGIAIDMPAGPSEVLIIADGFANPEFVAADLLAQAEHGPDSQVIMLTDNSMMIDSVTAELNLQLSRLKRKEIAERALDNSCLILMNSLDDCMEFSNHYAPEHLIIATSDPSTLAAGVINAGSVFLGEFSCESIGDYASGPNHTLPTNGYAKSYSGLSNESFMKKVFFQEVTKDGMISLGPVVEAMAGAEMLDAHQNAVTVRLKAINNE
ncbi:MAG: histidinol dehydrogenase [Bacteroidales bacterium]|jgi:histidinol dehydrogenase|nr:histidinol dehydrogenase [Bacteroidales bacterium]